jgi:hypothetical protein
MLSYSEHGKFPATTQGQSPRERDEKVQKSAPIRRGLFATVRKRQWTTGRVAAQWQKVGAVFR